MKHSDLLRRIYWISGFLVIGILVFLTSVIFLNPSSVGNPQFIRYLNLWAVLWAVNFVIILVLAFILARSLIKLLLEYQARQPGSRLKSKLVTTLILFSLFPTLIMAFLAFGLINRNLQQWFSSPSEQLLSSAQQIATQYYEQKRLSSLAVLRSLTQRIHPENFRVPLDFAGRIAEYGFTAVRLFDHRGETLYRHGAWPEDDLLGSALDGVYGGREYYALRKMVKIDDEILDRGVAGVPVRGEDGSVRGALFAHFTIPQSIAFYAAEAEMASRQYERMKGGVTQLEINYFSILALTTLAVIFGFVWLGTYIGKKITVPIEALAEGSRELAQGNLDYRVDVKAVDELGILVESFNRMARELKESRLQLEKANLELRATNVRLEERRRYIETILQNIATGVITINESEVIQTINEAALHILGVDRSQAWSRSFREVAGVELYEQFQKMKKRARFYGTTRKEVTFRREDRMLHVAASVTAGLGSSQQEGEYLIVLDDLTELLKAEKFAAWQEVARRLAHEFKNPLTPIQLSAERIKKRFEKLSLLLPQSQELSEFRRVLGDAAHIIVGEAETLKILVEEFSQFARMPISRPLKVRLHELIEQTLTLYDGRLHQVRVKKVFDPALPELRMDPEQMRRVFINLIDNSLDALAESGAETCIEIHTRFNQERDSVTIEFTDTGAGIAGEDYENLFLPYFSTKKRGTGLGLAIVRQIVSEHNGFVRAEPNWPRGTRFIMELPVGG